MTLGRWSVKRQPGVGGLVFGLALSAASCPGLESAETTPLGGVEFAGCASVELGPRCTLAEDRSVRFWLPQDTTLSVSTERGTQLTVRSEASAGGKLCHVAVPPGVQLLRLDQPGGSWSLALSEPERVPVLERARGLRALGQLERARVLLQDALPTLDDAAANRAQALLARLALARGEQAAALQGLRASMLRAQAGGRSSDLVQDATALAYVLGSQLHAYAEARAVLDRAAAFAAHDPASLALIPHYRGVVALESGDLRAALTLAREAIARTERLGLRDHELIAREQLATLLAILGRHGEAIAAQQSVLAEYAGSDACQQADRQETVTWFALLAEPAAGSALAELAERSSRSAEALLTRCPAPWRQRNHAIDAALLALAQGELPRARAALEHLPALPEPDAALDAWEHEARGRLRLASAEPQAALLEFQQELALAQRAGLWESQHLAWLGQARAAQRTGQLEAASHAYLQAEGLLDDVLGHVPLSEGQAGFQHAREAGTRELIALLVERGQPARALDVARHARLRSLRAVSDTLPEAARVQHEVAVARYRKRRQALEELQAAGWRVPSDQLAAHEARLAALRVSTHAALDDTYATPQPATLPALAVAERELVLALFPAAQGLRIFVLDAQGTRSYERPAEPAAVAQLMAAVLRDHERVRVISQGELGALDLHALSVAGQPLLGRAQVVYTADLEPSARALPEQTRSLVVSNPTADLAAADSEAQAVLTQLSAAAIFARGAATRARVGEQLRVVEHFHYAGHARYAGREGIDSALQLADGELTVGDILQLGQVPAHVVLSACEGARSDGLGFSAQLGVAQAFLAAGAQLVIAATRPVPDQLARSFFALYYAALSGRMAPAAALQRASLQLRAADPDSDWAAFRVLTR